MTDAQREIERLIEQRKEFQRDRDKVFVLLGLNPDGRTASQALEWELTQGHVVRVAAPAPQAAPRDGETAWLIERTDMHVPLWWDGTTNSRWPWTNDANRAQHFSTPEAAALVCDQLAQNADVKGRFKVREHMWVDKPQAAPSETSPRCMEVAPFEHRCQLDLGHKGEHDFSYRHQGRALITGPSDAQVARLTERLDAARQKVLAIKDDDDDARYALDSAIIELGTIARDALALLQGRG